MMSCNTPWGAIESLEKCIEKWQILSFELLDAFVIVLLCHKVFLSMGYFHLLKDNMLVGCLFMFFQQVPEKVVRHVSVAIFQWEKMHAFGFIPQDASHGKTSTFSAVLGIPELNRPHLPRVRMTHKIPKFLLETNPHDPQQRF